MYPTEFVKTQLQLLQSAAKKAAKASASTRSPKSFTATCYDQAGGAIPQPPYEGVVGCVKYTLKGNTAGLLLRTR